MTVPGFCDGPVLRVALRVSVRITRIMAIQVQTAVANYT